MNFEVLVNQLSKNPNVMPIIEQEIDRLVAHPDLSPLYELQRSSNPAVHIYLCKILELRIRRKITSLALDEEISFVIQLLQNNQSYHVYKLYSLLGLYCWPTLFPSFFDDIISLLSTTAGYQILLLFLEMVNSSTDIDDKRRSELKKAIGILSEGLLACFKDEYAEFIIPIFTEFIKIIPMNYDYSIVFRRASEHPEATIEFFSEASNVIDQNKIAEIINQLPVDRAMIQVLVSYKIKNYEHPEKVYEYIFKCLVDDNDCFITAVDFWQKVFSLKDKTSMLHPVLTAVTNAYLDVDEEAKEETDGTVFGFFSTVAKNYPQESVKFLKQHEMILPIRIISNFLQKIAKSGNFMNELKFENRYLNCLVHALREDPNTPVLLNSLDFTDKDSVKLALQIMERFEFSSAQINFILKMCDNGCLGANELKVECLIRLGIHETFEGEWNMDKVIKFYYFMRRDRANYLAYKESYYNLFILSSPFDRCFSIVQMIGDIPNYILRNIYEKMDKYSFLDLCCFNTDLLAHLSLEIQRPFIEKEVYRFISEWTAIKDYKEYYQALKSLLNIFSSRIGEPGMVNMMLDLVQIDFSIILNRILAIFNNYKGVFDTRKAVYCFITSYNAPNLRDSQAQLAASLTTCLYQPDGPQAFSEIMGLDINKCHDVHNQISKINRKAAQNIVRNLVKDFRGKSLRNLYENEVKVTKQNFLRGKPAISDEDS